MRSLGIAVSAGVVAAMALARLGAQPAGPVAISIAVDRPGAAIASTMFGIFFEDINFAADGGIYAEKIKNRSFEFPDALMGWKRAAVDGARGTFTVATDAPPSPPNPHYLRIDRAGGPVRRHQRRVSAASASGRASVTLSPAARARGDGADRARRRVREHRAISRRARRRWTASPASWARYRGTIIADRRLESRTRLRVLPDGPGAVDVDMVSLFPEDTWQGRENGLRRDLVQLLKDMKPGVPPLPRRLHRRGPLPRRTVSVEDDDRRAGGAAAASSTAGTTSSPSRHARLLSVVRARVLRILPVVARTSAPSRCRSSTAAWRVSSTRASSCRSTRSIRTSRTRST